MSLADSFLEDLGDLEDEDEGEDQGHLGHDNDDSGSSADEHDETLDEEHGSLDRKLFHLATAKAASAIGQLRASEKYIKHMEAVTKALEKVDRQDVGNLEDNPEYDLILQCNKIVHQIDDEIVGTHRFVAETYMKKFPELESLIPNKLDYVRTILRIQNEMDMTLVDLNDILPSASVMVVSVTGSTTSGKPLSEEDLTVCLKACEEVLLLQEDKNLVLKFVESRMTRLAPNLCNLIGARIAAQIVGLAGGIVALSKIPSCNIQVIGQEKRTLSGYSSAATMPHTGLLYYCDLVQCCPPFMRRKALKVVSGKVVLAARVDSYKNASERGLGGEGQRMRREVEEKLEKWQEPEKARTKKALPVPEEKRRSRRGGKRVRKMKERFAVTELRKQQNKISFSLDGGEYGDSAMGVDGGMIGVKESGKLRAPQRKESQLGKKMQRVAAASTSSGQTSGLSSSLVFSSVQGMELVNPNAALERVKAANEKWFSANSGFLSAAPK